MTLVEELKDRRATTIERLALDKYRRARIVTYEKIADRLNMPISSVRNVIKGRITKHNQMLSDLRRFRAAIDVIAGEAKP